MVTGEIAYQLSSYLVESHLEMSEQNPPPFPPGYANEYIGYVTRNVAISFTVLELLFVSLRFVSQHIAGKRCGVGDFIRIPSLVLCLGLNVSALSKFRDSDYLEKVVDKTKSWSSSWTCWLSYCSCKSHGSVCACSLGANSCCNSNALLSCLRTSKDCASNLVLTDLQREKISHLMFCGHGIRNCTRCS